MKEKLLFTWSGGKESALALYKIGKTRKHEITSLLTTMTKEHDRISMHGVRRVLLEQQAKSLALPLEKVFISKNMKNDEYESIMQGVLEKYIKLGVHSVAFGDISLEDVRKHREKNLAKIGMNGIFPLWRRDTDELANEFINLGFKAVITCVDSNALGKRFCGREFNEQFLRDLPPTVDPCGENGEFHSFVYDGPMYHEKISFEIGDVVFRNNRFYFCDLIPC